MVRLLLPFTVTDEEHKETFTNDIEKATILSLVELERNKGGGFILKRQAEEVVFIAEACYPLWLVPWMNRNLLFDGCNLMSHKVMYNVLPDIQAFNDEISMSGEKREAYIAFLSEHLNYFRDFVKKEEKTIDGLISASSFISDFTSYLSEATVIKNSLINKLILSPEFDESNISSLVQELTNLTTLLKDEVN